MNFKMYSEFLHVSVIIFNGKCLKKKKYLHTALAIQILLLHQENAYVK